MPKDAFKEQTPVKATLSLAAQRAIKEAEERRAALENSKSVEAKEINGRSGPEPVRYGDWENKGLASDF